MSSASHHICPTCGSVLEPGSELDSGPIVPMKPDSECSAEELRALREFERVARDACDRGRAMLDLIERGRSR